jgi:hypothetical protein
MGLSDTIFELVEEFQEMETQIGRKRPEIRAEKVHWDFWNRIKL